MSQVKIEHFYAALKDAVKYFPVDASGMKCLQPQTFAVLDSKSNLGTENLGKVPCDAKLPYFFSRVWHNSKYNPSALRFEWPGVFVFETNAPVTGLLSGHQQNCYNLQIMVADQFNEKCGELCTGCAGRVKNQIFADTERILYSVLNYFLEVVFVQTQSGWRLINERLLNQIEAITPGYIITEDDSMVGEKFLSGLIRNNSAVDAVRVEGLGISNLWGTAINLKVCFDSCTTTEYNFADIDKGFIQDIGCC